MNFLSLISWVSAGLHQCTEGSCKYFHQPESCLAAPDVYWTSLTKSLKTWGFFEVTCRSRDNGSFTSCITLGWCIRMQVSGGPLWSQHKLLHWTYDMVMHLHEMPWLWQLCFLCLWVDSAKIPPLWAWPYYGMESTKPLNIFLFFGIMIYGSYWM